MDVLMKTRLLAGALSATCSVLFLASCGRRQLVAQHRAGLTGTRGGSFVGRRPVQFSALDVVRVFGAG